MYEYQLFSSSPFFGMNIPKHPQPPFFQNTISPNIIHPSIPFQKSLERSWACASSRLVSPKALLKHSWAPPAQPRWQRCFNTSRFRGNVIWQLSWCLALWKHTGKLNWHWSAGRKRLSSNKRYFLWVKRDRHERFKRIWTNTRKQETHLKYSSRYLHFMTYTCHGLSKYTICSNPPYWAFWAAGPKEAKLRSFSEATSMAQSSTGWSSKNQPICERGVGFFTFILC